MMARLVVACVLLGTLILCCLPLHWLTISFAIDDAFYYLQVALNFVAGGGVTYDHRTLTNGFHPLWAGVLVLPTALTQGDRSHLLRIAFTLCGLFTAIGVLASYRLATKLGWNGAGAIVTVALLFFPRVDLWLGLMEAGLAMALLLAILYLMLRYDLLTSENLSRTVLLGVLLALLFLARLDLVFLVATFFVGSFFLRLGLRQGRTCIARHLLTGGFVTTIMVLPYLAANHHYFGSIIPVSGRRKQVWLESVFDLVPAVLEPLRAASRKTGLPFASLVLCASLGLMLCLYLARTAGRAGPGAPHFSRKAVLPLFGVGVLVRWIVLHITIAEEASSVPWYWVPEYLLFCLVAGYFTACLVARLPERWRATGAWRGLSYAAVAGVMVCGTTYVLADANRFRDDTELVMDSALWARGHLAPDKLCATYDAGLFGYFSRLDTIALNGLISDETTMLLARSRRYTEIMQRFAVDYWVGYLPPDRLRTIPARAVIHRSERPVRQGVFKGYWLCIVDREVYSPVLRRPGSSGW